MAPSLEVSRISALTDPFPFMSCPAPHMKLGFLRLVSSVLLGRRDSAPVDFQFRLVRQGAGILIPGHVDHRVTGVR